MNNRCIFHVGAHKTASTFFQECLVKLSDSLLERSAFYFDLSPLDSRNKDLKRIARLITDYTFWGKMKAEVFSSWRNYVEANPENFQSRLTIFSMENILGFYNLAETQKLYPKRRRGFELIRELAGDREVTIWLSVRSYETFLESVYSQSLKRREQRTFPEWFFSFDPWGLDWRELYRDFCEEFGKEKVIVWAYEDIGRVFPYLLEQKLGLENSEAQIDMDACRSNPGLSDIQEKILSFAAGELEIKDFRVLSKVMLDTFPQDKGYVRSRKIPPKTAAALHRMYVRHCKDLPLL